MDTKQQLEQGVNQGVVAPTQDETLAQGILDMTQFPIVASDSNIDPFLSDFDEQFLTNYDTLACNIFASIGMSEVYMNAIKEMTKAEFSERYSAVACGLNGTQGSSEQQWESGVNSLGLVPHADWPFDQMTTKEQFFMPLTQAIKDEGKQFLGKYTPFHRQIGTDISSLKEALKYGAVKIFIGTGMGWNTDEKDGVVPKTTNPMGHAVMLRRIDAQGYHIRDHYAPFLKCLAPDYIICYAFQTFYKKNILYKHIFSNDLAYGMTSPEVIALQIVLNQDGEFPSNVQYNQHFGPITLQAVQAFQRKYFIANPGELGYGHVGPKTRATLNQLYGS